MLYVTFLKPLFDMLLAALGLLLLSPLILAVMIVIRLGLGSPVIFSQTRIGLNNRSFRFLKFRTMTDAKDNSGKLLPDADRLTHLGRVLRASSLDELPQLWNVLKGDMSLIGPRPLLPEYLPRYSQEQLRRHEVKPGITGLAQIKGRNSLTWEEKFALDVRYVESCSALVDLKILLRTVISVARRGGISQAGHATMPEFLGSPPASDRSQ